MMGCKNQSLFEAYINFVKLGYECSAQAKAACACQDLTPKQIAYLRVIHAHQQMTFSELADYGEISKPKVTELIGRLSEYGCVYKERSSRDKRVCFIRLTEKGEQIAGAEEAAQMRLVERIESALTEEEIDQLIYLLRKLS